MNRIIFQFLIITLGVFNTVKASSPQTVNDSTELVDLLVKMIQFNTISGNEKQLGLYLTDWSQQSGLETRVFTDIDSSYNFMASLYPLSSKKPNFVFMGHIDVVGVEQTDWKYPPFSGVVDEGCIWGRGAIDDKGPVSMMLMALKKFKSLYQNLDLPFNLSVLVLSGEEVGGAKGALVVAKQFISEINPFAMFGEGGSGMINVIPSKKDVVVFGVSVNEKKPLWLKVEAKTKGQGHSASAKELYATKRLVKALIRIIDNVRPVRFDKLTKQMLHELGVMEGGFKGYMLKHSYRWYIYPFVKSYFMDDGPFNPLVSNTITITEISTDKDGYNSIPQSAYAILDCRLLPNTSEKLFLAKMKLLAGSKVTVSVLLSGADADDSEVNDAFKNMQNAIIENFPGSKVIPFLFPASSDNNTFRSLNIPVFGITPMIMTDDLMKTVHNSNERMPIDQLIKGFNTYFKMMCICQKVNSDSVK